MRYLKLLPNCLRPRHTEDPVVPVRFIFWGNRSNECTYQNYRSLVEELRNKGEIDSTYSLVCVRGSVDDIVVREPTAVLISSSHRNQVRAAESLFNKRECDIYLDHYIGEKDRPCGINELDHLRSEAIKDILSSL